MESKMTETTMSLEKMEGGALDLKVIEVYVSGDENVVNEPRLAPGANVGSLAALNKHVKDKVDLQIATLPAGHKGYATLAAAQAAQSTLAANTLVEVTNDTTTANNGVYLWNGTTLTKSNFDVLAQAKAYTDSFFTYYDAASLLTVKNYFVQASNGVAASSASFDVSDFIPVVEGETYNVYSQIAGTASHAWYDKDKAFISSFGTDQTTLAVKSYTAPANARYMRVSAYNTTARANAYVSSKSYVINKVKEIIRQHAPNIDASKIIYGSSDVNATLNTIIANQNNIIAGQNANAGAIDLITDKEQPFFVNTYRYVKATSTPTNFNIVDVTSRVSDNQMQVSDATAFVQSSSCVVYDAAANTYTSHNVLAVSGTTITVSGTLPSNPSKAQTMHDSALGQHLSLFGYKGLADFLVNTVQKYAYKKADNRLFNFNPSLYVKQSSSLGQITTDGAAIAITVKMLGTAKTGGYVSGTTNLIKWADLTSTLNIGTNGYTQYLSKAYQISDAIAGNGIEISFDAKNSDGFVEIPLAVRDETYTSSTDSQRYKTNGNARLQVLNGSTVIHDAVYNVGQVHYVYVDFTQAATITVKVTLETSTPTFIYLGGIFAYKKSAKTSTDTLFKDGDVVAFLGDSWTQYPIATSIGGTGQTRPDGSVSTGSQWLSRRMKEKLASQGKNVTMLNMGFGGQTSRWGKYWVDKIIALTPKPTHCVICFYINDNNGINNTSATAYDFSPTDMFTNVTVANGGVDGRVRDYAEWESNLQYIVNRLTAANIKPIVIMPSQTASVAQAQAIRSGELDKLADGFN